MHKSGFITNQVNAQASPLVPKDLRIVSSHLWRRHLSSGQCSSSLKWYKVHMREKQNLCEARHFILALPMTLGGRHLWKKESSQVCPLLLYVSNHHLPLVSAKVLLPAVLDSAYLPSLFLPWESHKEYEEQKDRTLKDELLRSVGAQYATGGQWRNNSRKNEGMEPKQKQHPVVDVTVDRSKLML